MPPIKHENNIFPLHRMNLQSRGRTLFSNIRLDSSFLPTSASSFEAFQDGVIIEMPPSESTSLHLPSSFSLFFCRISLLDAFSYLIFYARSSYRNILLESKMYKLYIYKLYIFTCFFFLFFTFLFRLTLSCFFNMNFLFNAILFRTTEFIHGSPRKLRSRRV